MWIEELNAGLLLCAMALSFFCGVVGALLHCIRSVMRDAEDIERCETERLISYQEFNRRFGQVEFTE